jgi:hypothetical protein
MAKSNAFSTTYVEQKEKSEMTEALDRDDGSLFLLLHFFLLFDRCNFTSIGN